jgi:hypothetical protein
MRRYPAIAALINAESGVRRPVVPAQRPVVRAARPVVRAARPVLAAAS